MKERSIRRAVHSAAILESVEIRRLLSAVPDATFGTAGLVHFNDSLVPPAQYDQIVSAQNASGITTVAEISDAVLVENQLLVRRFSSSGAALNSGTVTLPFSSGDSLIVTDVAVDAADNVFVAGSRFDISENATIGFVVKIDASGAFDPTFAGGAGSISTPELAINSQNVQLALNGGLVYATYVTADTLTPTIRTANTLAFDSSGAADLAYGLAGTASNLLPQIGATVNEVLVDGSGLLLFGTTADNASIQSLYVGRLDGVGTPDVGFGTSGFGVTAPTGYEIVPSGATRVSDGYLIAGTAVTSEQVVVKIASDLTLDETFDGDASGDGVVVLGAPILLSPLDRSTRSLTSDADGNLYLTGIGFGDDSADLAVIRLDSTGALDTGFDDDGIYTLDEAEADIGIGLTTTPAGAILVVGSQVDGLSGENTGLLLQLAEPVVVNAPPVVASVVTDGSVDTGVSTNFSSSFSDVDGADTFTVAWDFGDGNTLAAAPAAQGAVSASHTYTVAGSYTVTLTVTDSGGNIVTSTGSIVVTTPPPPVPYTIVGGQLSLTGNTGNDTVELVPSGADYVLTVNGTPYTITDTLTSVIITGGDGADFIRVSSQLTLPVTLVGGTGNDTLRGGSGNDVITGDEGDDLIIGRDGNDLMIGGTGSDFLIGREDSDILVSGSSTLSSNLAALSAIMAEWTSNHSLLSKLGNVTGILPQSNRLNGNFYLTPGVTVFADSSVDTLSGGDGADLYYISLFGLNADIIRDGQNSFSASVAALVFGD